MIAPSLTAAPAAPLQLSAPVVRSATPADEAFVDELQAIAFGPGRFARTAFRVRERFPIDPSLSLIAEVEGTPCGSVWMTPISIGGVDGYMLGPLATHPNFRKRRRQAAGARSQPPGAGARGGQLHHPCRRFRLLRPARLCADAGRQRDLAGPR